jgi:hypothetical protein
MAPAAIHGPLGLKCKHTEKSPLLMFTLKINSHRNTCVLKTTEGG